MVNEGEGKAESLMYFSPRQRLGYVNVTKFLSPERAEYVYVVGLWFCWVFRFTGRCPKLVYLRALLLMVYRRSCAALPYRRLKPTVNTGCVKISYKYFFIITDATINVDIFETKMII
jgi:hypothetical protein